MKAWEVRWVIAHIKANLAQNQSSDRRPGDEIAVLGICKMFRLLCTLRAS